MVGSTGPSRFSGHLTTPRPLAAITRTPDSHHLATREATGAYMGLEVLLCTRIVRRIGGRVGKVKVPSFDHPVYFHCDPSWHRYQGHFLENNRRSVSAPDTIMSGTLEGGYQEFRPLEKIDSSSPPSFPLCCLGPMRWKTCSSIAPQRPHSTVVNAFAS